MVIFLTHFEPTGKIFLHCIQVPWDGYLTVEREVGESPREDIELAVTFLKRLLTDDGPWTGYS